MPKTEMGSMHMRKTYKMLIVPVSNSILINIEIITLIELSILDTKFKFSMIDKSYNCFSLSLKAKRYE